MSLQEKRSKYMKTSVSASMIGLFILILTTTIGVATIEASKCSIGMGFKGGFCEIC